MGYARCVRAVFSPLDEELGLGRGQFTPSVYEGVTRLSTWMPFGQAVKEAAHYLHVTLSEATVRRHTEAAGAAYVAVQSEEVERLEREAKPATVGVVQQFLSVDGAFVPLVGGEWAEVKTLAIGTVKPSRQLKGETVVQTDELSYFSRLADAKTFQRLALVETERRGLSQADAVGAVTDGSDWCQGFVDFHRPNAVRILDFPHAAEYVATIGQACLGADTAEANAWLAEQLHTLKHDGPTPVLTNLRQLAETRPGDQALSHALAYLTKRESQMAYPTFQAEGWPIGDGAVESANKLVVEARLKGSGMHWARPHIDPMLALRTIAANDRWTEAWPQILDQRRRSAAPTLAKTRRPPPSPAQPTPDPTSPALVPPRAPYSPQPKSPYRPPASHPWRRPFLLKTKRCPPHPNAKL